MSLYGIRLLALVLGRHIMVSNRCTLPYTGEISYDVLVSSGDKNHLIMKVVIGTWPWFLPNWNRFESLLESTFYLTRLDLIKYHCLLRLD